MRCDAFRELFDDLDAGRLSPALEAALNDHVSGCADCAGALARDRAIAAVLRAPPAPALPQGFEAALARRLREARNRSRIHVVREWLRAFWPSAVRYAVVGGAAAALTAVLYANRVPAPHDETATVDQPGAVVPVVAVATPEKATGRVCNPADQGPGLRVKEGEEIAVTLSVHTPEPMEGAKVYVVLPRGLEFSPVDHPDLADKRVLSFTDDIGEGDKDYEVTVRGTKPGRWDLTTLVEQGDSVLLAGTTIAVAPQEDLP